MQRGRKLKALQRALDDEGWVKGASEAIFYCRNPQGCNGGHHKRKLSVNLETDQFHCWVCHWRGGSLIQLLRLKGDTDDSREYAAEREQLSGEKKAAPEKKYDLVALPREFLSLSAPPRSPWGRQAMAYLGSRGLTIADVLLYKIGYCEDGPYKNRVIIPSFDEHGELNFFVGRSFYENDMKYKHGDFCKDVIFNDCMVNWHQSITLVEGPFDMIKAGANAIPLQGTYLSEKSRLFAKIVDRRPPVYIALDNDAFDMATSIAEKLSLRGIDVKMVNLGPNKDPGDMTKEEFQECKRKAVDLRSSPMLFRLKALRHMRSGSMEIE
jgi:hypothetical protein